MMLKSDIRIRYAEESDSFDIAQIEKECFSSPWSEKSVNSEIKNELCIFLTAVCGDKVCGYISGLNVSGEFYISNIAVTEDYRKNHIGTMLIEKLLEILRECKCSFATLEVRESNTAAINLYKNFGFELKGCRKNFYTAPVENALIYTLYF